MSKQINYNSRNFGEVRSELVNFIKQFYPDILTDFNDSSVGMMLLELNAAVGDMLSHNTDRMFHETQIDFAQERRSLLSLARTFGLKVPGKRPSVTIVDWSVTVPVLGDTFDVRYAPIIRRGSQAIGAGKVFEVLDDIDFSSPFSIIGLPNRLIIPNIDSNGTIQNYTLTKREIAVNGSTKIFKRVISSSDSVPFFEMILPDDNVLSVENIITLPGANFNRNPDISDFLDFNKRWYEMDSLADNKIFVEDNTRTSDRNGIRPGKWVKVSRRFVKEFTDRGFCKITFGSGMNDVTTIDDFIDSCGAVTRIGDFINNIALGEIPRPNTTMFIRYRVGGGATSNIGPNILRSLGFVDVSVQGPDSNINTIVSNSVRVNNPIPALGGAEEPSIVHLRNLIKYNFAAQNRCVTIKDYQSRITLMSGRFGAPFRVGVAEDQNKISVSIIGLDENGKLTNTSNNTLKTNIAEYLSDFRMINDFIEIKDGRVINLSFEIDLFIDKQYSRSEIINGVIGSVISFFDIQNRDMGENIYLGQLIENINNVGGVLNVVDIRTFNKIGDGKYSLNEISQPYLNDTTREIDLLGEFTLFAEPNSMFEIKFPEKDIKIRVKG